MIDVTVVVATYGEDEWIDLAGRRALPSAHETGAPTVHSHDLNLHDARNGGLGLVHTEWVCFLDADDELEPGYFDQMATGTADVRAPSVRYVKPDGLAHMPYVPRVAGHGHDCTADCLQDGNWLVVGSLMRTEQVRAVGGWREWPVYEDWDLMQRLWVAGATFEAIPRAIYRAYVRADSRNRAPSIEFRNEVHHQIRRANLPHLYEQEAMA